MRFASFYGCNIPARIEWYASASKAIFQTFGAELVTLKRFGCCGYPMRNLDATAAAAAAARNMALAERAGLDMVVFCACCYGSLRAARHRLARDRELYGKVAAELKKEGLEYTGKVRVRHYLSVLYEDIGTQAIEERIRYPLTGLKVAAQYGCRLLRPSAVAKFDDPFNPHILDDLVRATGAQSIDWGMKLDCCGAPLTYSFHGFVNDWSKKKIRSARKAGADILCSVCPYCYLYFRKVLSEKREVEAIKGEYIRLTAFPALLGRSMGLPAETLGLP